MLLYSINDNNFITAVLFLSQFDRIWTLFCKASSSLLPTETTSRKIFFLHLSSLSVAPWLWLCQPLSPYVWKKRISPYTTTTTNLILLTLTNFSILTCLLGCQYVWYVSPCKNHPRIWLLVRFNPFLRNCLNPFSPADLRLGGKKGEEEEGKRVISNLLHRMKKKKEGKTRAATLGTHYRALVIIYTAPITIIVLEQLLIVFLDQTAIKHNHLV